MLWSISSASRLLLPALALTGCAVLYPEMGTALRPTAPTQELDPPPPADLYYIAIQQAQIPQRTRDGRAWDETGNGAPDPYAVVFINDEELFRTSVQSDAYEPKWADSPKLNYTIPKGAKLKVEVWEDNPVNSEPICIAEVKNARLEAEETGELDLYCTGGTSVLVEFQPAKARWGTGLYYELRGDSVGITRTLRYSPAYRAGLRGGEEVVSVNGQSVKGMSENQVRSAINGAAATGIKLSVRSNGQVRLVEVKDGPVYWLDGMSEL